MNERKILSHSVKPFSRYGIQINEALWLDGIPYFTSKAIAEWLELKAGAEGINKIVQRNQYILEHTKTIDVIINENYGDKNQEDEKDWQVNLTCQSPENPPESHTTTKRTRGTKMRIFSPIGLQLVAMESNNKKAKEYKVLVATLVWKMMQGKIKELTPDQKEAERVLKEWATTKKGKRYIYAEKYMKLTGCSKPTAYRHYDKIRKGENPADKNWRNNTNYIKKYGLETKIRQIFFENPQWGYKKIWKVIGCPKTPCLSTIKKYLRKLEIELLTI